MKKAMLLTMFLGAAPVLAIAQDVTRHAVPGSDFPIARAVEVPGDKTVVYLSGAVPAVADASADPATAAAWGDTKAQTVSILEQITATLADLDLTMGDVVKMQAFLVAPEGEAADFAGFMAGYTQFFGTKAQPNLPARSAMIVNQLVNPHWLIEIEVTAVRP